jgi:hypothetical protein
VLRIRELIPYIPIAVAPLLGTTVTMDTDLVCQHVVTLYGTGYAPPAAVQNRARVPALPAFTSAGARSVRVFDLRSREFVRASSAAAMRPQGDVQGPGERQEQSSLNTLTYRHQQQEGDTCLHRQPNSTHPRRRCTWTG